MMNLKTLLLSFLFSGITLFTINAQNEWNQLADLPFAYRYDDIYFVNPDTGFVGGSAGTILKTTDGGASWKTLLYSSHYIRSLEFLTEEVGFAGTLSNVLYKTEDGGENWIQIEDLVPGPNQAICGFAHLGDSIIYGVGIWAQPGYFIISKDQGATWSYQSLSDKADGLVDCHFLDEETGFVAGIDNQYGGIILKTEDGGENWERVFGTGQPNEYIWKLDFISDSIAYASIESFGLNDSTYIVKTVDGGNSWEKILVSDQYYDLQGVGFLDEMTGWAGPRAAPLFETQDGGQSWNALNIMPNINRIFRLNDTLLFASGSEAFRFTAEPSVGIRDLTPSPIAHEISELTPNPFSSQFQVEVRISQPTYAIFEFFDGKGRLIKQLHHGRLSQGVHRFSVEIDEANTPSGLYYLALRTNEGFHTRKVVKR